MMDGWDGLGGVQHGVNRDSFYGGKLAEHATFRSIF
jgi:hypothetical protein